MRKVRRPAIRRSATGHRIGEQHHRAKLTDADVRLIRTLHADHGLSYSQLSDKFEAPKRTIRAFCAYERRAT